MRGRDRRCGRGFGVENGKKKKKAGGGVGAGGGREGKEKERSLNMIKVLFFPAPHKIKASLDEYVVGQEQAKKVCRLLSIITTSGLRG